VVGGGRCRTHCVQHCEQGLWPGAGFCAALREALEKLFPGSDDSSVENDRRKMYYRVWIVDENQIPTGILSLTDLFRILAEQEERIAKRPAGSVVGSSLGLNQSQNTRESQEADE
jgi:hypothetical protein